MPRASRRHDPRQGDMLADYEVAQQPAQPGPGSLDMAAELCAALAGAIKAAPYSRAEIAARMSDLTGKTISEDMLNKWTSKAGESWRFPMEFAVAFEFATGSHDLMLLLARKRNVVIMTPKESRDAEIGRAQRELAEKRRYLRALMEDRA